MRRSAASNNSHVALVPVAVPVSVPVPVPAASLNCLRTVTTIVPGLSASAATLAMARMDQARFAECVDAHRSALEADAAARGTHTPADAREQAARLALAREYARACVAG